MNTYALRSRILPAVLATLTTFAIHLSAPDRAHAQTGTWQLTSRIENGLLLDVECRSNGVCAMVGEVLADAVLWISTDAGRTWQDVYRHDYFRGSPAVSFSTLQFVGDSTIVVGCTKGMVAISTDLGRTFTYTQVSDTAQARSLQIAENGRGAIVFGAHPVYRLYATNDGGRSWSRVPLPDTVRTGDTLRTFPDRRLGVTSATTIGSTMIRVVMTSEPDVTLLSTTDGGASWLHERFEPEALSWMKFVDSSFGFLYGGRAVYLDRGDAKPAIYRTLDGGQTWARTLTGARIRDIATHDGRKVIAVGEINKIYTSLDSGLTWSKDSFPVRGPVTTWCDLADSGNGFLIGAFGDLFHKSSVGGVVRKNGENGDARLSISGNAIVVHHGGAVRSVVVNLHNLAGELIATIPARRVGPDSSVAEVSGIQGAYRPVVAIVSIDGRRVLPGHIVAIRR
ncbi:MAG TPA: hypothetical protein VNA88_17515 [Candidatus Kapabacteria bacterium]|jgi:photosystem II stability/assembly factor-like uncharacterized protein|nr:hypothetical protein [Candidatus Kapabacteria bacterium]